MQVGGLHLFDYIAWVRFPPADYGKDTKLQDTFSHLALGILYVHFFLILIFGEPSGKNRDKFGSSCSGFYYYKLFVLLNKTNIVDI